MCKLHIEIKWVKEVKINEAVCAQQTVLARSVKRKHWFWVYMGLSAGLFERRNLFFLFVIMNLIFVGSLQFVF